MFDVCVRQPLPLHNNRAHTLQTDTGGRSETRILQWEGE